MTRAPHRYFLLSPADTAGPRAQMLLRRDARFELAERLRGPGVPLADVFAFVSSLYFRGKIGYARRFAQPARGHDGVFIITAGAGLVPAETPVRRSDLERFAEVEISLKEPRYREPLERSAEQLARALPPRAEAVLLGSIASNKYVEVLHRALGDRLMFPIDFVGRGDMSRGGLLLRSVRSEQELRYVPIDGAVRRGVRPAKLEPVKRQRPQRQWDA